MSQLRPCRHRPRPPLTTTRHSSRLRARKTARIWPCVTIASWGRGAAWTSWRSVIANCQTLDHLPDGSAHYVNGHAPSIGSPALHVSTVSRPMPSWSNGKSANCNCARRTGSWVTTCADGWMSSLPSCPSSSRRPRRKSSGKARLGRTANRPPSASSSSRLASIPASSNWRKLGRSPAPCKG